MKKENDVEVNFRKKVNKDGPVCERLGSKCWEWQGALKSGGYGNLSFQGKTESAHRVSWILENAEIPDSLFVLHKCDNRKCVNPDHLFLGTQADNIHDMIQKGRGVYLSGDKSFPSLHPEKYQGERNGRAKLTEKDVLEIRSVFSEGGASQKDLRIKYNVSSQLVSRIINGGCWKNLLLI